MVDYIKKLRALVGHISLSTCFIYLNGDEVYFINIVFITKIFQGKIVSDGKESSEVRSFQIDNLPKEITPTNIRFLQELGNKIDAYL